MKDFNLGIVIPTYNEKDNISELLELVYEQCVRNKISTQVLVMDDNSPDGTADIVRGLSAKLNSDRFKLQVHVRPQKMGLASAYIQGFQMLKDKVDYLLSMDADLSHKPEYVSTFLSKANEGNDFVIGSRNIKGGGVENWPFYRVMISKAGSFYARTILGVKIFDFTGGYNLYRSDIFNKFDLNTVKAQGYLFQIEMKYSLAKHGYKFTEFPIIFPDRTRGKSKISKKIIIEAFIGVWGLRRKFSNISDQGEDEEEQ
jgi:dolichol-phosphate mannosyltransferase